MTNKIKKAGLVISTCLFVSTISIGVAQFNTSASAEESPKNCFTMEAGAGVKLGDDGLRFIVKLGAEQKETIEKDNVALKFYIAPKAFFDAVSDRNYQNLSQKVEITVDEEKIYQDGDYYYANGCLTGLGAKNQQNLDFVGVAAIVTTGENAPVDYQFATFAEGAIDNNTRSQYDVINSAVLYNDINYSDDIFAAEHYAWYGADVNAYPVLIDSAEDYTNFVGKVNAGETFTNKQIVVDADITKNAQVDEGKELPTYTNRFTVSYELDGESAANSEYVLQGNKATMPKGPTKEGFIFSNWTLDGENYDFNTNIEKSITLKAKMLSAKLADAKLPIFKGSVALPAEYKELCDYYELKVKDAKGAEYKPEAFANDILTIKDAGYYTLEYTLSGGVADGAKLTRDISVAVVNSIKEFKESGTEAELTAEDVMNKSAWFPDGRTFNRTLDEVGLTAPEGAIVQKNHVVEAKREGNASRVTVGFNISAFMDMLYDESLKDSDYLKIWLYSETGTTEWCWTTSQNGFRLCDGRPDTAYVNNKETTTHHTTKIASRDLNVVGRWYDYRITVKDLRAAVETKPGYDYYILNLDLRTGVKQETKLYFYSIEFGTDTSYIVHDFDNTSRYSSQEPGKPSADLTPLGYVYWDHGVDATFSYNAASVVKATTTDIGKPAGTLKKDDRYMKMQKFLLDGAKGDLLRILPTFHIGDFMKNLGLYNDNDYVSLWMYDELTEAEIANKGVRSLSISFTNGQKDAAEHKIEFKAVEVDGKINDTHGTYQANTWVEYKITVKQIKDALTEKGYKAADMLRLRIDYTSHRDAVGSTNASNLYFYSLEFHQAN